MDDSPKETVQKLLEIDSWNDLEVLFAVYTKLKGHDGRIYPHNRKRLESVEVHPTAVELTRDNPMDCYKLNAIHPAHINQLIDALYELKEEM